MNTGMVGKKSNIPVSRTRSLSQPAVSVFFARVIRLAAQHPFSPDEGVKT
jgi:hypothetical protein